ncbi:hypothetical protein HZA42_04190 [Candidatus Peregrinibacteria bacterium]|nr:hypothetical protein [Candidatus Peregrinibacteria bacterium]
MKLKLQIAGLSLIIILGVFVSAVYTQAADTPILEPQGRCDPAHPFDPHVNGIIHCRNRGTNGQCTQPFADDEYPSGLCFPSFNNYTDGRSYPLFSDERRFMLARLSTETPQDYRQQVNVRIGDRVEFTAYVHNDADPWHNPNDGVAPRSMARDVKTFVNLFSYDSTLNNFATGEASAFSINQSIAASNTTPGTIWDDVQIVAINGQPVRLKYVPDSARFEYGNPIVKRFFASSDFFGGGAFFGSPDTNSNNFYGSEDYRGFIRFAAEVIASTPPPPVFCRSISIAPHEFQANAAEPAQFTATADPPNYNDIMWEVSNGGNIQVDPGTNNKRAKLTGKTQNTVLVARSTDGRCRDEVKATPLPPPPPPPPPVVCQNITVNPTQFRTDDAGPTPFQITNVTPSGFTGNFNWSLTGGGRFTIEQSTRGAVLYERNSGSSITIESDDKQCRVNIPGINPNPPPPPGGGNPPPPPHGGGGGGGGGGGPSAVPCNKLEISPTEFLLGVPDRDQTFFIKSIEPGNFTGAYYWTHYKDNVSVATANGTRATFKNLTSASRVEVYAIPAGYGNTCKKAAVPEKITIPPANPKPAGKLTKRAFGITASRGNVIKKGETAEFQIAFDPSAPVPEVIIKDSMRNGKLVGSEDGVIELARGVFGGKDFKVEERTNFTAAIQKCSEIKPDSLISRLFGAASKVLCYEDSPFDSNGIKIKNINNETILITYRGQLLKSNINETYCKTLSRSFCGEKFTNSAGDSFDHNVSDIIFTPCPFLLTKGIGDVILQEDLDVGSDISSCAGIPNIEGPVVKPKPEPLPNVPRTGADDEGLNIPAHTLCQQSNTETNTIEAYKNPLKSVSSAICEMSLTLNDILTPPKIRANVVENITRITRYNNNLGVGQSVTVSNLNAPNLIGESPNPNFAIYKLKNGNLTIDRFAQKVGQGARTYVIENGDLIINGNIEYESIPYDLSATNKVPSIAFIVINGSIKIDPSVTNLSGIFVALKGEGVGTRPNSGKILGTSHSNNQLTFEGSVFGDIEPLFESRTFTGNASQGQGTIVINYDGRLFYNMPPGLNEILEVSPEQVAR